MESSFEVFRKQAEALGLKGDDVAKYVINQQNIAREERTRERELKKEELETDKARIEADKEKARIEAEKEKVKLAHELELARLQVNPSHSILPVSEGVVKPSLPVFKDNDDIASYLIRFERVASLLDLAKETYAVRLGSLLTGKAVDIYTSLSPEITANYDELKKALLQGFSKTSQGYRSDFRSAKIKVGETFKQFSINLGRLFDL